MTEYFSNFEKAGLLLELAQQFVAGSPTAAATEALNAFDEQRRAEILELATQLESLPVEAQRAHRMQFSTQLRRPTPKAPDPHVHPSRMADLLLPEPPAIRNVILARLDRVLSERIAAYLEFNFDPPNAVRDGSAPLADFVFSQFLAQLVTIDDLAEADDLDRFSIADLDGFIHHLGLREIAIACRGIASKETLAAFLNRFDRKDAREIGRYLTELSKIRPFWVAQADVLVRRVWNAELLPSIVVRRIGLRLLALAFIHRDARQCAYTAQKLPVREQAQWRRMIRASRRRFAAADDTERTRQDKRRRIVERLAVKYSQNGRL